MKKTILGFILGIIVTTTIYVGAETLFKASEISYANENSESNNVQEAIDDLTIKHNYGDATSEDILEGKKALVNGKEIVGSLSPFTNVKNKVLSGFNTKGAQQNLTFDIDKLPLDGSPFFLIIAVNVDALVQYAGYVTYSGDDINFVATHKMYNSYVHGGDESWHAVDQVVITMKKTDKQILVPAKCPYDTVYNGAEVYLHYTEKV